MAVCERLAPGHEAQRATTRHLPTVRDAPVHNEDTTHNTSPIVSRKERRVSTTSGQDAAIVPRLKDMTGDASAFCE